MLKRLFAAILLTAVLTGAAQAGPAVTLTTPGSEYSGTPYTLGFRFTVVSPETITRLGIYDDNGAGLAAGASIGLWNTSGMLLRSVTLAAGTGGALIGRFRYAAITPFTVTPGTDYIIGGYLPGDSATSLFTGQGGTGSVDPNVVVIRDQFSDWTSSFALPNTSVCL